MAVWEIDMQCTTFKPVYLSEKPLMKMGLWVGYNLLSSCSMCLVWCYLSSRESSCWIPMPVVWTALFVFSPNSYVENPISYVIVFGDGTYWEVTGMKVELLLWDLWLYKKRNVRSGFSLCYPRTYWEDHHLQTRKRALRSWICQHLDLGLPRLPNCEK